LAAQLGAPQLLTDPDRLSADVTRAADELGATTAVVVGDVGSAVADDLTSAGLMVERVGTGTSPYGVAADVAGRLGSTRAYIVPVIDEPDQWQLPLATAGIAAFRQRPLLYTRRSWVPAATVDAIRHLGDDTVVRPRLLEQLEALGVTVRRVRSSDRYAVSARFADVAHALGARTSNMVVASGTTWTTSAAMPALAAILGQVTVIVASRDVANSQPTATWLRDHRSKSQRIALVGGVRSVRPRVEAQLERRAY
jgi:putative cell wall-binding protein